MTASSDRDWLFQAKSFNLTKGFTFDWAYCKHNGWLTPRNKALIRQGFEVVDAAAVDECAAIEADTLRLVGIGLNNVTFRNYGPMNHEEKQKDDAHPGYGMNYTAARLTALWMCAMGGANGKLNGAGCDMAYCAYTYGDLHGDAQLMPGVNPNNTRNGKMCMYEECVGWRPAVWDAGHLLRERQSGRMVRERRVYSRRLVSKKFGHARLLLTLPLLLLFPSSLRGRSLP